MESPPASLRRLWSNTPRRAPAARIDLVCFPYAGGGASMFQAWPDDLPESVEVSAIRLPGREARLSEPAIGSMRLLVTHVARALAADLRRPFAFFGHSLGGLVAFEVARELQREHGLCPVHLFLSAAEAPDRVRREPRLHDLPRTAFIQTLKGLDGTPPEVLAHDTLMDLLMPALRADFCLSETYSFVPGAPLPVSLTLFGGTEDPLVSRADLEAWVSFVSGRVELELLPGGHFFIRSARSALLAVIADRCHRLTGRYERS